MSKLTKLLEYSCAGNSKRRSLMDRDSFMNSFNKEEKQLMLSETGETDLVVREVLNAIVVGAKSRESARHVVPIINVTTNTARVPYGNSPSGQYAGYVAEGAAITQDTIEYDKTNVTIKKAAIAPYITNELIEDQQFDVIEMELKKAGAKLENKLNQQVITTLLDGVSGPNNVTPNGAHISTYDIGIAQGNLEEYGWMADAMLLQPLAAGYLMDEINMPDVLSNNNSVMGLNTRILNAVTDGTGTAYWDRTVAANHYGGLVFDSYNYAFIAMREDISTTKINDPMSDVTKLVAKMRFGVGILNPDAACRILSK